jgi:hypothetical protein
MTTAKIDHQYQRAAGFALSLMQDLTTMGFCLCGGGGDALRDIAEMPSPLGDYLSRYQEHRQIFFGKISLSLDP